MATIGTLAVKLTASTASFQKGLNAGISSMQNFQSKVGSVGKSIAGMALKFGGLLGLGSAAGGLGLGIKLAADAEQSQIAFATMLGDADLAKRTLQDLSDFAASTPFQLPELRSAGQSLLAFGVSADELMPSLQALGDVSAGIRAPIGEIAEIFGKAKTQGTLFAEDINQLTGRGIPIIQELAKQFGVAESQVKKLVSEGKVNFGHLQKAFADMSGEGGKFAGMMANQSKTLTGLWSTLKDNVGLALGQIGAAVIQGFGFKDAVGGMTTFVQSVGAKLSGMLTTAIPIIQQITSTIVSGWNQVVAFASPIIAGYVGLAKAQLIALWQVTTTVWESIKSLWNSAMAAIGVSSGTFAGIKDMWITSLIAVEFAFLNWQSMLALAVVSAELSIVRFANQVVHFFGTVIPGVVSWAYNNWQDILKTWVSFTSSIFINISKNVIAILSGIWDFIASGGTAGFNVAWTPLTDGFTNAIKELPKIAEREVGGLEAQLQGEVNAMASGLNKGLDEFTAKRRGEIFGANGPSTTGAAPGQQRTLQDVVRQNQAADNGPTDQMRKDADAIKKSLETPADKFVKELNKINELQTAGLLNQQQADMARGNLLKDANKDLNMQSTTNAGKALEAGTAEAFTAANTKNERRDTTEDNTKATAEQTKRVADLLEAKFGAAGATELEIGEI